MAEKLKNRINGLMNGAVRNKKGFTLTELLVCVAILGVLAVSAGVMMSSGTNMFNKLNQRVNVSYQTRVAMAQLKEFFIDCDAVCKDEDGKIYILNSNEVFLFDYDDRADEVKMKVYPKNMSSSTEEPFAKHISTFNVEVYPSSDNLYAKVIRIELVSSIGKVSSSSKQVISLKNVPVLITEADADPGKTAIEKFKEKIKEIGG